MFFFFRLSRSRFDEVDVGDNSDADADEGSGSSYSDSDSDSDDIDVNVNVSVRPIDPTQFRQIPDEERSTHFIAIKITEPEIVRNAVRVQQHIAGQEEVATSDLLIIEKSLFFNIYFI